MYKAISYFVIHIYKENNKYVEKLTNIGLD